MASENDLAQNLNEDRMRMRVADLERLLAHVRQGGGQARIDKEHAKGKWTARERLNKLFDPGCERLEIGALAGHVRRGALVPHAPHGGQRLALRCGYGSLAQARAWVRLEAVRS